MSPTIVSNIENFVFFRTPGTGWGKSTVERGFGRKVAPGGAKMVMYFVIHRSRFFVSSMGRDQKVSQVACVHKMVTESLKPLFLSQCEY